MPHGGIEKSLHSTAESVTENRNRYRDILKTETDTDVGIEKKNEKKRKPTKKRGKNENSVFADNDLLISSIFIFCR